MPAVSKKRFEIPTWVYFLGVPFVPCGMGMKEGSGTRSHTEAGQSVGGVTGGAGWRGHRLTDASGEQLGFRQHSDSTATCPSRLATVAQHGVSHFMLCRPVHPVHSATL